MTYVSTIRISTATTNRNENAATKRTVVSPNSATAKQQLTTNTTDSNINKLRLKFKHAVFCSPVPTDGVNVNDRAFAGTDLKPSTTTYNQLQNTIFMMLRHFSAKFCPPVKDFDKCTCHQKCCLLLRGIPSKAKPTPLKNKSLSVIWAGRKLKKLRR